MTDDELRAFGIKELTERDADLACVKAGTMSIELARTRVRRRAVLTGLTPTRAFNAMVEASLAIR